VSDDITDILSYFFGTLYWEMLNGLFYPTDDVVQVGFQTGSLCII